MEATTLSEARVYVGTYGKYNNGSLFGAWLDLSDYLNKEDFYEACRELQQGRFLRSLPGASQGRGRCRVYVSGLGERAGGVNRRKLDFRELLHPAGCGGAVGRHRAGLSEEDADDLVRDFWDEYQGQYDDEEDFAYRIVEECYDLPEFAKSYFDYEKFARDLFMCDYWMDEGFVFRAA